LSAQVLVKTSCCSQSFGEHEGVLKIGRAVKSWCNNELGEFIDSSFKNVTDAFREKKAKMPLREDHLPSYSSCGV